MKQLSRAVGGLLCVFFLVAPAAAWDFSLTGQAEWRYRYISRTGPGDLFGDATVAQATSGNATSIGLAGPQSLAVRVEGYSSKGSDAAYAEQRFFLYPEFSLNPAIRVRAHLTFQGNVNANYRGGGANWVTNPHYSGWTMIDSRDLYGGTGLSVPVVRAFWATARTPWATVTLGTRPAAFGMGWGIHEEDSYARSLSLIVPYGPFSIVLSQYLHDPGGYGRTDPNDDRNTRRTIFTIASGVDQNEGYGLNTAVALRYAQGNLDCGSLLYVMSRGGQHVQAQRTGTYQDDQASSGIMRLLATYYGLSGIYPMYVGDWTSQTGMVYAKYMDGRFFFNAEYDFLHLDGTRDGGRPIDVFGQCWAGEMGVVAGPAKISLAHFYRSGHDRRGGILALFPPLGTLLNTADGRPAYVSDKLTHFVSFLGAGDSPIKPYCFLLGLYGAGNNSYTATGACSFDDFLGNAARVDYAAAANLNVFASFIRGQRASNTSTPQGYFNGVWGLGAGPADQSNFPGTGTRFGVEGAYPQTWVRATNTWYRFPNVPDNDLGWEANAGFDWKLLEGMTLKVLGAYWQPGYWFKWAYQDMSVSTADFFVGFGNLAGRVNPERTIDPIMAIQTNLLFDF